jgi:TPR repeat protein
MKRADQHGRNAQFRQQDPQERPHRCTCHVVPPLPGPYGSARVPLEKIDWQIAITACEAAAAAAPDNPRIMFQLGRAHDAAKADESARAFFSKASDLGYAAARVSLGLFYAIGRGGLAKDDREALRLFKLAAEQGQMADEAVFSRRLNRAWYDFAVFVALELWEAHDLGREDRGLFQYPCGLATFRRKIRRRWHLARIIKVLEPYGDLSSR